MYLVALTNRNKVYLISCNPTLQSQPISTCIVSANSLARSTGAEGIFILCIHLMLVLFQLLRYETLLQTVFEMRQDCIGLLVSNKLPNNKLRGQYLDVYRDVEFEQDHG